MVYHRELQGRTVCLHQFLPELRHEPLVLVRCNCQWQPVLADDVVEEGISYSIHVLTLQQDQHYHLTEAVHDHLWCGNCSLPAGP